MKPTEELFHLGQDPVEMVNLAKDSRSSAELALARNAYDTELAAMKAKVVRGHGHEPYPALFDRTLAWEKKEPMLKATKVRGGGGAEDSPNVKQESQTEAAKSGPDDQDKARLRAQKRAQKKAAK